MFVDTTSFAGTDHFSGTSYERNSPYLNSYLYHLQTVLKLYPSLQGCDDFVGVMGSHCRS